MKYIQTIFNILDTKNHVIFVSTVQGGRGSRKVLIKSIVFKNKDLPKEYNNDKYINLIIPKRLCDYSIKFKISVAVPYDENIIFQEESVKLSFI